ncbi:hypothetical protein GCM10009103_05540 [Pseudomonas koreensis]|nr:hypothetical protein GCM10009103_05540 [Pseudomonas koreensis]
MPAALAIKSFGIIDCEAAGQLKTVARELAPAGPRSGSNPIQPNRLNSIEWVCDGGGAEREQAPSPQEISFNTGYLSI